MLSYAVFILSVPTVLKIKIYRILQLPKLTAVKCYNVRVMKHHIMKNKLGKF